LVKRLLVATVLGAALAVPAAPAHASTTRTGGAQIQWTSAATATMSIATQYSPAFAQGNGVPTLLPSVAGACFAVSAESNFTLTFGGVAPRPNTAVGCLYQNALAVAVQTNDASGFVVNEYLDVPPTNGVGICAYPNGGASFPLTPVVAPVPASSQSGNPAAGTFTGSALTGCAAGGGVVPAGTGGASSAGTTPGNPGTVGLEYYSPSTSALTMMSMAGPTVSGGALVSMYGAEDIQVNLGPGAKSMAPGLTGDYITIQLILN
jgi:hypothetical protein